METYKRFVPVIGENKGYWIVHFETPKGGQLSDSILQNLMARQVYVGVNRSFIFYAGSSEQVGNFQTQLKSLYKHDVMTDAILKAIVKSVPDLSKK